MTFRKDNILFYEEQIASAVIIVLCLALIPLSGIKVALLGMIPFVLFLIINPQLNNEYITINNNGIYCSRRDTQLWGYSWEEISFLKKGQRYLLPSMEIMLLNAVGETSQYRHQGCYFLLNRTAKKAIQKYYKGRIGVGN